MVNPFAIAVWGAAVFLYVGGWIRLRSRRARRLTAWWRAGLAGLALGLVGVAFVLWSTKAVQRSFALHMLEHEILIELTPILLWLSRPVPIWLWGIPNPWRRTWALRALAPHTPLRRKLHAWTRPRITVPLYLLLITFWHLPALHDLTLQSPWIHLLEWLTLGGIAFVFWWMVLAAPPKWHVRKRSTLPLVYIVAAYAHNEILGLGLTLLRRPLYTLSPPPEWPVSPLVDQALGGAVMWIPGELIYTTVLMGLLMRLLDEPRPYQGTFDLYEASGPQPPTGSPYSFPN